MTANFADRADEGVNVRWLLGLPIQTAQAGPNHEGTPMHPNGRTLRSLRWLLFAGWIETGGNGGNRDQIPRLPSLPGLPRLQRLPGSTLWMRWLEFSVASVNSVGPPPPLRVFRGFRGGTGFTADFQRSPREINAAIGWPASALHPRHPGSRQSHRFPRGGPHGRAAVRGDGGVFPGPLIFMAKKPYVAGGSIAQSQKNAHVLRATAREGVAA